MSVLGRQDGITPRPTAARSCNLFSEIDGQHICMASTASRHTPHCLWHRFSTPALAQNQTQPPSCCPATSVLHHQDGITHHIPLLPESVSMSGICSQHIEHWHGIHLQAQGTPSTTSPDTDTLSVTQLWLEIRPCCLPRTASGIATVPKLWLEIRPSCFHVAQT